MSRPSEKWPAETLRNQTELLQKSCALTEKSGFTADLLLPERGSLRIDATWSLRGELTGQIVSPLGEDLANFRIDSSGQVLTDLDVENSLLLNSALHFLASLGPYQSRMLLCSGLFLKTEDLLRTGPISTESERRFDLVTRTNRWFVSTELKLNPFQASHLVGQDLQISTTVATSNSIFSTHIATLEWTGIKKTKKIVPHNINIRTRGSDFRLLFLDFE
jgi:hypothetical protein